jgi:hypothetical protein
MPPVLKQKPHEQEEAAGLLAGIARERLKEMHAAGLEILECYRLLEKAGANVVGQCLAHQGTFYELEHYPKGDVFDEEFGAQYYYHAHRPDLNEHGHFHTFIRAEGMPVGVRPVDMPEDAPRPLGEDAVCHLVAISMDPHGYPTHLFTVNRWVTNETFYSAEDTLRMVERFKVEHVYPCLATNRWITAMLKLFWPQIRQLLHERDAVIAEWQRQHPERNVYEDRELEIPSRVAIDVDQQISLLEEALKG